jgi:hypothetical protein
VITVGFTGTRWGMTDAQKQEVAALLKKWDEINDDIMVVRHGCCVGADEDFTVICQYQIGFPPVVIVGHPPIKTEYYSQKAEMLSHYIKEPRGYLARDRHIVNNSDRLIATPFQDEEQAPDVGGTWYTMNYAGNKRIPVYTVFPDGKVREP